MKLLSVNYLFTQARDAFLRFPITIISSILGMFVALYIIEYHDDIDNYFPFINLLLCLALGVPLFFGAKMYAEKSINSRKTQWILRISALLFLVFVYFTLPNTEVTTNTSVPYIRYVIYNICIHLMVSFAPFIMSLELNGFWQYNKSLFLRILTSALFSAFIYGGLVIAMGALNVLFDVDFEDETYFEILVAIIGLFNTWFFVSGVPSDFLKLNELKEYPKGLKIFTQYVLMPLLVLYFLILYSYTGKIIMLWDWPKGIVSYMISAISVLGIFQILLFYPYGFTKGNEWIRKASKGYYFMMLPMIIVLFFAIGLRLGDYGITINRYIIVLLGVWLSFISIYFIIGKTNIKMIPISLTIIILLTSFGPWSMFTVSERSQVNRLEKILTDAKFLEAEKIRDEKEILADTSLSKYFKASRGENDYLLSDSIHNEIKSILDYLDDFHGFNAIAPWFEQNVDSLVLARSAANKGWSYINQARVYMEAMGLSYMHIYSNNNFRAFYFDVKEPNVINLSGYEYILKLSGNLFNNESFSSSFELPNQVISLNLKKSKDYNFILIAENDTLDMDLNSLITTLLIKYKEGDHTVNQNEMKLHNSNNKIEARVDIGCLNISQDSEVDSLKINDISGKIFLKIKE